MKYCHVCLAANDEELELHVDRLNDKAARKWAVSKSDIMTCERTQLSWTLSHSEILHSVTHWQLHAHRSWCVATHSFRAEASNLAETSFLMNAGSGARRVLEFSTFTLSDWLKPSLSWSTDILAAEHLMMALRAIYLNLPIELSGSRQPLIFILHYFLNQIIIFWTHLCFQGMLKVMFALWNSAETFL